MNNTVTNPISAKLYRFDARLNEEQKLLIQRAADMEGRSMTDFVLHSAEIAAQKTIEQRAMMTLNARDTAAFVDAILEPASPDGNGTIHGVLRGGTVMSQIPSNQ